MDIDKKAFDKLEKSVNDLRQHNFFRMHENIFKLAVFNMVRGIAYGFGWVMGATILVYILTLCYYLVFYLFCLSCKNIKKRVIFKPKNVL